MGPYERVGVDRALAIALDLALQDVPPRASVLDLGCSVGTISSLLGSIGYQVVGVDNDIVAAVQSWHDVQELRAVRRSSGSCRFVEADIRDFLRSSPETHDVGLLLSVLHHWLGGYGYTGRGAFARDDVRTTLRLLRTRIRRHLYVEVPTSDESVEAPPDPEGEFLFPAWFLREGFGVRIELIASTIATNGKARRLYRVDL